MEVKIIAEKSSYKGQIHKADHLEGNVGFPYRIKMGSLITYWKDDEVEVIEAPEKEE